MPDPEKKPEGGGTQTPPEGGAPATPPVTPPATDSEGKEPEDNAGLKTALHKERQARRDLENKLKDSQDAIDAAKSNGASPEVVERLNKVESELQKAKALQPFVSELGDQTMAEAALGYYEKLTDGVTDKAALEEMRKRAIRLAAMDGVQEPNVISKMTGGMRGSSRPAQDTTVSAGAAEMAGQFGVDPEKLKEANRPVKGLYN